MYRHDTNELPIITGAPFSPTKVNYRRIRNRRCMNIRQPKIFAFTNANPSSKYG